MMKHSLLKNLQAQYASYIKKKARDYFSNSILRSAMRTKSPYCACLK